jgi:hypothetical protein
MWGLIRIAAGLMAIAIAVLVLLDSALFANLLKRADES